jgi:zinc transporter, ZIP family
MWGRMGEAFLWGALGGSFLLIGALVAYLFAPGRRVIAVVMALGTGVLIGSVSFELVDEALKTSTVGWVGLLVLVGAATFAVGDWLLARQGASARKDPVGRQAAGAPLAIVLGSVLDGIPESFVLGLTVIQGGVSLSLLAGVSLSNLPEGMASSSGLKAAGWPKSRVMLMWSAVVLASALSAAAGYQLLDPATGRTGAFAQAFAAGALLAMVTNTLLPEAYAVEGVVTGPLVVTGFAASLLLASV